MDIFLLNQKDLESKTVLPKIFCNRHHVCRNMHIAIETILTLTHTAPHILASCLGGLFPSSKEDDIGHKA